MTTDFMPPYDLPSRNRRVILSSRPDGVPLETDFEITDADAPSPGHGEFLVRNVYLSADPVQRGWAANPDIAALGDVMKALGVGVVVESNSDEFAVGDVVFGFLGWQDYCVGAQSSVLSHTRELRAPMSLYAGVLGMPGVTADLALHTIAPPKAGDTVLVSTAAGAVGSVVGQIAKQRGARTIGLTGSDEKVARCVEQFGYDEAFNYKKVDLAETLARAASGGFNTYFDNTGGPISDIAIRHMAKHGRIIQCGTAATPVWTPPPTGWRNEREILTRVLTWTGFYIFDHRDAFDASVARLSDMVEKGALAYDEDIDDGIEAAPRALETLFSGANTGKKLIYVGAA